MKTVEIEHEMKFGDVYQIAIANGPFKPMCRVSPVDYEKSYFILDTVNDVEIEADTETDARNGADVRNMHPAEREPKPATRTYCVQLAPATGEFFPFAEVTIEYDANGVEVYWIPTYFVRGPDGLFCRVENAALAISTAEILGALEFERRVVKDLAAGHELANQPEGKSDGVDRKPGTPQKKPSM